MLNIVIPMAGAGSRFASAGYTDPKPLIPVHGVPMIKVIIDNLRPAQPHRYIFICQRAHDAEYGLAEKLAAWAPSCAVVLLDGLTEGAACTVLAAKEFIDSDDQLMIANSDQYVEVPVDTYLAGMNTQSLDGLIMTMASSDPKWSFVGIDEQRLVTRVVEKEVISNEATVGIYNFKRGLDFVRAAERMIAQDLRVNGEFYVAPAYNQLVQDSKRVGIFNVGAEGKGMHGLGIPSDLEAFVKLPISNQVLKGASVV